VNLPFEERWKVHVSQQHITLSNPGGISHIVPDRHSNEHDTIEEMLKHATPNPDEISFEVPNTEEAPHTAPDRREMLVVISVSTDDKRSPYWRAGLRLFLRAGAITIYVFATSVFAAVSLLALPMAQMILMVILGVGFFSRAIVQGLVLAMYKEKPIMHLITEDRDTANAIMEKILHMQPVDPTTSSYVLEINGKLWAHQLCVGFARRWRRFLFGSLTEIPLLTTILTKVS
jgi:hypothetical protein